MPFSRPAFSGFPFDRDDRDDHFHSQLDDIAKRHPEFAEHLEGFPFRSGTLGRRRPPRPSEQEFPRFANRPFGSGRFERFGFPFNDAFDEDFPQHTSPQPESPQPQPQTQPKEDEKPKPERERGRKQNIQQSNTVDLGQKQEPVNDRNQRSMSAPPPDNRQRYVSSIHIPINRDGGMGDMGKTQSQPQQQDNKPVERVIPIHVEGRDEPVLPKHTGPSFSQPQPDRIFGHSPSQFTQFVGPQRQPEGRQQQKFQQTAPPPPPPQKQPEQRKEEKPQEVPKTNTPIDLIQSIQKDVSELMGQVENFGGMPKDKQYLYLDEMLTRNLIKLDNIDTQGQENIRQARKEAIKCIQTCINILEAKANANEQKASGEEKVEQPFAGANPPEPQKVLEEMDTEEKEKPVETEAEGTNNPTQEKMEVAPDAAPVENKPQETQVSETTDNKADEEMKEAPPEDNKGDEKEASPETGDDIKEKKRGKKKVVKN